MKKNSKNFIDMKQLKHAVLFISVAFVISGCSFSTEMNDNINNTELNGICPSSIKQVVDIFELKYGEVIKCIYNGEIFAFSITDVEDLRMPCSLMYSNEPGFFNKIRIHATLRMEIGENVDQLKVSSVSCGTWDKLGYNRSDIVQQVWDEIEIWESERAIYLSPQSFQKQFTWAFGEGTLINNTAFSIFIAHAEPNIIKMNYDVEKSMYKFIFIITTKN